LRLSSYSIFLIEDKQTESSDDGQGQEDFQHVNDDVLVYWNFDDHVIPAQERECWNLAFFEFLLLKMI
jgi:hypothetical protein